MDSCEVENTVTDRLVNEKRRLESKLADVNAALDALKANPEVAKVLTLVGKAVGRI
jgi:chaperonin cofactor prefoldin